jgi:sugar O-acyltransferase (sialic acid O-acetyltransferase NeuD family)
LDHKVIFFGYSGHAWVVIDSLIKAGGNAVGYLTAQKVNNNPYNLAYLGFETDPNLKENISDYDFHIAVGENSIRQKISEIIHLKLQRQPISIFDPSAMISDHATVETGVYIGCHTVVNFGVKIGKGTICNSSSVIEHECTIGSYCHIAPGAVLCGNVSIGDHTLIGANATVLPNINIGKNCIIGAGSVIHKHIPDHSVVVGNPGKIIK